jgi:hypothetical protein
MSPETKDGITLALASLGTFLGVLNLWRTFDRDRIKLRILPQTYLHKNGFAGLAVEVVNMSWVPVTLREIGFCARGGRKITDVELAFDTGKMLPIRLEPRESVIAQLPLGVGESREFARVHAAYARTACGRIFSGTSPALGGFVSGSKRDR